MSDHPIDNISMNSVFYKSNPQAFILGSTCATISIRIDTLDDDTMYSISCYSCGSKNANHLTLHLCVNKQQFGDNQYLMNILYSIGFTNIHLHTDATSNKKYIRFNHNGNMTSSYDDSNQYKYTINQL